MYHLINTAAKLNPAILTFIFSKINAWMNFCDYHCDKQKELHLVRIYRNNLTFEILSISIVRMLNLNEQRIMSLLNKQTTTGKYSQMDIWMLKTIKDNVFSAYSAHGYFDAQNN